MPRHSRIFSNSKIYHIIIKGIDSSDIFYSDQDRKMFLEKIKLVQKNFPFKIYAYCLMSNHVHIILKVENELLSKLMHNLSLRYSRYFNSKYKRKGSLFQDRFYSRNIENQKYFLAVCKYVHKNPEKAGIALTSEYPWSSYSEYLYKEKIIDKKILLHYFNNSIDNFIKYTTQSETIEEIINYADFEINTHISDEELVEIIKKICNLKTIDEIFDYFKIKNNRMILKHFKNIKEINISQLSRITRVNKKALAQIFKK